jgi:hypothetical protein
MYIRPKVVIPFFRNGSQAGAGSYMHWATLFGGWQSKLKLLILINLRNTDICGLNGGSSSHYNQMLRLAMH